MLVVRFDMRAPGADAAERADRYDAAVDMCAWGEQHGVFSVVLSEHHGVDDGYLPSPLTLAAAIAARTTTTSITIAALLAPLHRGIELAEQMVVLDHLSRGRVSYVLGLGYRPDEYELYGLEYRRRARLMEDVIADLREAFAGTATPPPFSPGGPLIMYGGGSEAAARRAGRLGLPFYGERSDSGLEAVYREAEAEAGNAAGFYSEPPAEAPMVVVVAEDVDAGWRDFGPHLLYDALEYQRWRDEAGVAATAHGSEATTVDELRAEDGRYRVVDRAGAHDLLDRFGVMVLMPMCGGAPPELGWTSLRLAAEVVAERSS